jgi:glycerol-3-phosphate acyltransferase PlsY
LNDGAYIVAVSGIGLIETFIASFLVGSIPFGLIVGRLLYKSDLRQSGSGNVGAANALRSYGKLGGVLVLVLDAAKGFVPVLLVVRAAFSAIPHRELDTVVGLTMAAFAGFSAVLGHCYSPWLKFKGGKGVATWLGALFALSWIAGLAFVAIWLAIVIPTRYASLGSVVSAVLSPVVLFFVMPGLSPFPVAFFAVLAAFVIVWKHRDNIARLREGRENKISFGRSGA